jgi:EAL domain-containing protein (putative c-di-GMP-specific phosphodiesterase class I)
VLTTALQNCAGWYRSGLQLNASVDITAADLLDAQLPYELARLINGVGLMPSYITLEISEDALLIDQRRTARALNQLRQFGLRLALDHYGRTAPSLAALRTMPVDELKLHSSFVGSLLKSPQDAALVRSTVDLARSLGAVLVADGVNSRQLLDAVMGVGCTVAQGPAVAEAVEVDVVYGWAQQPAVTP